VKEYDKPAIYWYKKIIESLSESNFDKADNYYISLRSEHSRSPLLPTAPWYWHKPTWRIRVI